MNKEQMKELIYNLLECKIERIDFDSRDECVGDDTLEKVDKFSFFLSDGTGPYTFYFVVTKVYNVRNNGEITNVRFSLKINHDKTVHMYADESWEFGNGDVEALYNYCHIRQKVDSFYKVKESISNILLAVKKMKNENEMEKKNG